MVYEQDLSLIKFVNSWSLPLLRDKTNKCFLQLDLNFQGLQAKITRKKISNNCITEILMSYKREFNFTGKLETFVNVNVPYVRVSDRDLSGFYFDFSHQSLLEKCFFLLDVSDKFKSKKVGGQSEKQKEQANADQKDENQKREKGENDKKQNETDDLKPNDKESKTTIQKLSDDLNMKIKKAQSEVNLHDPEIQTSVGADFTRLTSLDKLLGGISTKKSCLGHFDYRRGVYPYRTSFYEIIAYGEVEHKPQTKQKKNKIEKKAKAKDEGKDKDEEASQTSLFSLKLEGHLNCNFSNQIPDDIIKIENRILLMKPVFVHCDLDNDEPGTPRKCDLLTFDQYKNSLELTMNIVFEVDFVQKRKENKWLYQVM